MPAAVPSNQFPAPESSSQDTLSVMQLMNLSQAHIRPTINVVAKKQIGLIRRAAPELKDAQQIVELGMDIAYKLNRGM